MNLKKDDILMSIAPNKSNIDFWKISSDIDKNCGYSVINFSDNRFGYIKINFFDNNVPTAFHWYNLTEKEH